MDRRPTTNRTWRILTLALLLVLLPVAAASANTGGGWTNLTHTTPSARDLHAMATLGGDQVLLFGGDAGAYNGETWVYDLSDGKWSNMAPAAAPAPSGALACYDTR